MSTKFSQEVVIFKPKTQSAYPITKHNWDKIKEMLNKCIPSKKMKFRDWSLLLIGGAISAGLSLAGLYTSDKVANWILILNLFIFLFQLAFGLAFLFLSNKQIDLESNEINHVLSEMTSIEQLYDDPTGDPDEGINNIESINDDMGQNFDMVSGDSKILDVSVDFDLTGVKEIIWVLKKSVSEEQLILKSLSSGTIKVTKCGPKPNDENVFEIKLEPQDTKDFIQQYYHEAKLIDSYGNVSTVMKGTVTIFPSGV